MFMDIKQKILSVIKIKGPILPVQIAKAIETNILMASAHLSELASSKKLKISNVKIGGSPLYYLEGQESMLQKFSENLHEKEKKAYELLKEKKVLKDSELEPVIRFALGEIKDYSKKLEVTFENKKETFWKWFLTGKEESENIIKEILGTKKEHEKKTIEKTETNNKNPNPEQKKETKEEEKKERAAKDKKEEDNNKERHEPLDAKKEKPEKKEEPSTKKTAEETIDKEETQAKLEKENPKKEQETEKETIEGQKDKPKDDFFEEIKDYLSKTEILVEDYVIIRKNSEIDLTVSIKSGIGSLSYYCNAKNKKKLSDTDISSAYVKGKLKKLPVLIITKGTLTKKAKELLDNKEFSSIKVKMI